MHDRGCVVFQGRRDDFPALADALTHPTKRPARALPAASGAGVHLGDSGLLGDQLLRLAIISARLACGLLRRFGRFLRRLRSRAQRDRC